MSLPFAEVTTWPGQKCHFEFAVQIASVINYMFILLLSKLYINLRNPCVLFPKGF